MIIKNVSRTYSRSINTKNYGLLESWIKIESSYTAECESGDDAVKVSSMLYDQAKSDVLNNVNVIIEQIKSGLAPVPPANTNPTPSTAAPVTPVTPTTPFPPVTPSTPNTTAPYNATQPYTVPVTPNNGSTYQPRQL